MKMNLKLITNLAINDETMKFKAESRKELHNLLLEITRQNTNRKKKTNYISSNIVCSSKSTV